MTIIYLASPGASLHRKDRTLRVWHDGAEVSRVALDLVSQVVVIGNAQVTTPALHALLAQGIPCTFVEPGGRVAGSLVPEPSAFGELRLAQYAAATNAGVQRTIAARIVRSKILNQLALLARWRRRGAPVDNVQPLWRVLRLLRRRPGLPRLVGLEGTAAAAYFELLRAIIPPVWRFEARRRRPPPDPVNAMLSFGYTLLLGVALAAVNTVGLDPFVGVLHQPARSRPSLALDVMEEFRPLVDAMVLEHVHAGTFEPADFERADGAVRLGPLGLRRFIAAFEALAAAPYYYGPGTGRLPLRGIVEAQARRLARVFLGRQASYAGFIVRA